MNDSGKKKRTAKATDIYSLGMLFWEIATGDEPFKKESILRVIVAVGKEGKRPVIPEQTTPGSYATLIQRCWKQRSEDRPEIE